MSLEKMLQDRPAQWLKWAEGITVLGSVGGTVAAAVTQQMLFACVPLSAAMVFNLASRREHEAAVTQAAEILVRSDQQLSASLQRHKETTSSELSTLAAADQLTMMENNKNYQAARDLFSAVEGLTVSVTQLTSDTAEMSRIQTELLESTVEESYYRRGLELEKREDYQAAIKSYAEALRVNSEYPEAYLQRGAAYAQVDQKQQAVEDFRSAAKLFFEQGDLDNYQKARDLSNQVHHQPREMDPESAEEANTPAQPTTESAPSYNLSTDELFV